jgi:hypothetical protein
VQHSLTALMTGGQTREQAAPDETSALSGSLANVSLVHVLRRAAARRKPGRLSVTSGRWAGEVWLVGGRVIAARCGVEQGLEALDALTLAVTLGQGGGTFAFEEGQNAPPSQLDQPLSSELVTERIEAVPADHLAAVVRDPAAVPRVWPQGGDRAGGARWPVSTGWEPRAPEELDPPTLRLLLAVNGRRTVEQLTQQFGLARTARGLAKLWAVGLLDGESLPAAQAVSGVEGHQD